MADIPPIPEEFSYLWDWYRQLFTGTTLTFSEIHSWVSLMGYDLAGWEVEEIKNLDRIYWSVKNG